MAQLIARPRLIGPGGRKRAEGRIFEGVATVAKQVADIAFTVSEKQKRAKNARLLMEATSSAIEADTFAVKEIQADRGGHETWVERYESFSKDNEKRFLDTLPESAKPVFQRDYHNITFRRLSDLQKSSDKIENRNGVISLNRVLGTYKNQFAEAKTDDDRVVAVALATNSIRQAVDVGYINPDKGMTLIEQWDQDSKEGRLSADIFNDPDVALDNINNNVYGFSPETQLQKRDEVLARIEKLTLAEAADDEKAIKAEEDVEKDVIATLTNEAIFLREGRDAEGNVVAGGQNLLTTDWVLEHSEVLGPVNTDKFLDWSKGSAAVSDIPEIVVDLNQGMDRPRIIDEINNAYLNNQITKSTRDQLENESLRRRDVKTSEGYKLIDKVILQAQGFFPDELAGLKVGEALQEYNTWVSQTISQNIKFTRKEATERALEIAQGFVNRQVANSLRLIRKSKYIPTGRTNKLFLDPKYKPSTITRNILEDLRVGIIDEREAFAEMKRLRDIENIRKYNEIELRE
jgi:hypothetical protein